MEIITTTEDQHAPQATTVTVPKESMKIQGEALAGKVKQLLHEGNVRRIVVKNDQGHTVMEIPVTAGVIVAVAVLTVAVAVAVAVYTALHDSTGIPHLALTAGPTAI